MSLRIAALCLVFCSFSVYGESVPSILGRMDAAAPLFHAAISGLTMHTYESIIDSDTKEDGSFEMQRNGANDVRAILTFTGKGSARTLFFQGKRLLIYFPNVNSYQIVDMGGKSQLLNQYLLLGFGSSGKDLAAAYDISDGGTENINGQPATKLVLIPKDEKTKASLSKVEIWIPPNAAYPVQQKFYQPNGDTRTVTYSDVKINPSMHGNLEFKVPSGAKQQK